MNDDFLQGCVEGLAVQPLYVGEATKQLCGFIIPKLNGVICNVVVRFIDDKTGE